MEQRGLSKYISEEKPLQGTINGYPKGTSGEILIIPT